MNAQNPPANAPATPPAADKKKYPVNLPKTAFAMKANLVQNEPASLKRWQGMKLYEKVRAAHSGKPKFVFHDGPPYANGSIHLGHLMNKCLKDMVVRSKTMQGLDVPYVPGWDCHGLPIEHKVMTELQEKGKLEKMNSLAPDVRKMAVRRECQAYAEKYHKLHTGQMSRLLTLADYEHPYLTMQPSYEGATLEVLAGLVEQGLVYRALKPVHWSIANETALAEAELEYEDREDLSVYVDFEAASADAVYGAFGLAEHVADEDDEDEEGPGPVVHPGKRPNVTPSFMIWTTTPWTLPANVGVAVHPKVEYALVWVDGNVSVMASGLVEKVTRMAKAEQVVVIASTMGDKLVGLKYRHPFVTVAPACGLGRKCDADKLWSIVAAEYVTVEDGTGLVHTAPGHGQEDYQTGLREGLPVYSPVKGDGTYDDTAPDWLRGRSVWDANQMVHDWLRNSGHLFFSHKFTHSYPHDWRSKTPVIFRCTEQWFVSVDGPHRTAFRGRSARPDVSMRKMALEAVDAANHSDGRVSFVPEWGRNRMRGMLESRPDWCISRQRAWGLPIPAFVTPEGLTLLTTMSVQAVARKAREKGADVWFTAPPEELLSDYDPTQDPDPAARHVSKASFKDLKKGNDILDVWFESGSSWNACMRERGLGYPVDLYLEGSDQHRGWFQLSLLPALGVTGRAPFRTLLTHGFINDKDGRKLSKSRPDAKSYEVDALLANYGADVMRWWVSTLAYENDVKADLEFFTLAGDAYRKVRNTLRFMLSNLDDFTATCEGKSGGGVGHCVDLKSFPDSSLDAWVLAAYDTLASAAVKAYNDYDFKTVSQLVYDFCNDTLSAVYLAAIKDRMYCDKPDSPRRRRTQTTLWELTDGLCRLLAPILPHTADEAYRALWKVASDDTTRCVHLTEFITSFGVTADPAWTVAMKAAAEATKALEKAKAELGVENRLDAGVVLPDPDGSLKRLEPADLADVLGVSRVTLDHAAADPRIIDLRSEPRCDRSWKRDGTVKQRSDGGWLSQRDAEAVGLA
jgi:isoleucyl-tRNA synthetase